MRKTDTHLYFWSGPFSNFTTCDIDDGHGHRFKSSEQLYMYLKARYFKDDEIAEKILKCGDPKIAKNLGRKVSGFKQLEWDMVKFDAMVGANRMKYKQNPKLAKKLMETKGLTLVEASPYDCIWGVGLSETDDRILNEYNWKGENLLGDCLMLVRRELLHGN